MSAGYKFDASAQLDLPHADPLGAVMSYVFFFSRSGVVYSSINYSDIIFQASIYNVHFLFDNFVFLVRWMVTFTGLRQPTIDIVNKKCREFHTEVKR